MQGQWLTFGAGKSPGVTGAATERPLEGVAEDPTGAGYIKDAHSNEWA